MSEREDISGEIEALADDEAFLHALAERMHCAHFSKSGETYPVARNFIRSMADALQSRALSQEGGE